VRALLRGLAALLVTVPMIAVAVVSAPPAGAQDNGLGLTPLLGWSSWSFIRRTPTAAKIEAQADAMVSSGLKGVGYRNVNVDDFWYQCPGSQGPNVDEFGRWVIDGTAFPSSGSRNGIQAVADYVHGKGLKFGLYMTPGISKQAVAQNTAIEGTPYHAADIATTTDEKNYNCRGMVGIDYSKPGAQEFIDSWAKQFASWDVDYLKLDGVGSFDVPDLVAWSTALRNTGRPIHLELSNNLAIGSAATWKQYSNGWRTGGDVECYCGPGGASYPLTDWSHVSSRFNQVANWAPYGGPGGFNDYDSIEVGNGSNDGLTLTERKTQMSLWALAASPFILGTDLTNLDPTDLALLTNTDVLAVDQDAIDATRILNANGQQIFTKKEPNGDAIVGLFNTSGTPQLISTSAATLGMAPGTDYLVKDLWSHQSTETTGALSATVPSHGVAFYRVSALSNPTQAPPNATLAMSPLPNLTAGKPATATASFTDNGDLAAKQVRLGLQAPTGWSVTPTSPTSFPTVETGQTVQATFQVVAPASDSLFQTDTLTGTASYTWSGKTTVNLTAPQNVTTSPPVQPPYQTFSSATDAPASFGQIGQQFGISGAGADLFSNSDAYSTIYLKGAVGTTSTVDTKIVSQQGLTGFGKAGIIVRNDATGSGTMPEGVILFASPSGGIQLEWTDNGGNFINAVTPANGTNPFALPVWLKLERTGDSYTGYYSNDGKGWYTVGTATVSAQAATQDAGIFVTSHSTGTLAQVVFDGLTAVDGAVPPPPGPKLYEAESPANTIVAPARISSCTGCSGGQKVGFVGNGGTVTFNGVTAPSAGNYDMTIYYLNGPPSRDAVITVNGVDVQTLSFTPTTDFNTVGTVTVPVPLVAGANTIEFSNPAAFAPDFDRIAVAATPS
jgi:Alpha galactosidase A/NPCBM-associated, NEW3 domain of alpha-galactosidase/Alpha galactosidase C-terminal beta sandwich domain/Carbohydrate binding module (family 35)